VTPREDGVPTREALFDLIWQTLMGRWRERLAEARAPNGGNNA
jgi:hypothetical protein